MVRLFLLLCGIISCKSDPSTLPLLPSGNHLGMIVGFDAYSPENLLQVQARLEDLQQDGLHVHRIQMDWIDIEPQPREYDTSLLEEALEPYGDDDYIFLLLAAVDSEADPVVLPPDLRATPFSGLTERYKQMLGTILPILRANNVFLLSIGNEPDAYLELNPTELEPMVDFVAKVRDIVHETDPNLAVSMTLANVFPELAAVSDVVVYNWYALTALLEVTSIEAFIQGIDDRQSIIGENKPFVIQEVGVPAGFVPSTNGGSAAFQQELAQALVGELIKRPNFRAAFWFTLVDWSESTTELLASSLEEEGVAEDFVIRFREWLRTGGLLNYEQPGQDDMNPRPAWETFRQGLRDLYNETTALPSMAPIATPTKAPTVTPVKQVPESSESPTTDVAETTKAPIEEDDPVARGPQSSGTRLRLLLLLAMI